MRAVVNLAQRKGDLSASAYGRILLSLLLMMSLCWPVGLTYANEPAGADTQMVNVILTLADEESASWPDGSTDDVVLAVAANAPMGDVDLAEPVSSDESLAFAYWQDADNAQGQYRTEDLAQLSFEKDVVLKAVFAETSTPDTSSNEADASGDVTNGATLNSANDSQRQVAPVLGAPRAAVPTLAEKATWYQGSTPKSAITKINIVNSYTPSGTPTESWDASSAQDGSIMAYIENATLTIAGNGSGKIKGNGISTGAFADFSNAAAINGVGMLDMSNVAQVSNLFSGCKSVQSLDVGAWDTGSFYDMSGMFNGCEALTTLDVSNWDTANSTSLWRTFRGCSSLTSLDVSGWNTSKVKAMGYTFYGMPVTSLNVSNWDLTSCKGIAYMFARCANLKTIDLSNWDTSSVEEFDHLFYESGIESINLSTFDLSSCTRINSMFLYCDSLKNVNVSGWSFPATVQNGLQFMFAGCTALESINLSSWNVSQITSVESLFQDCENLTDINVGNWNTSKATDFRTCFSHCYSLETLDLSSWDTSAVPGDTENDLLQMFQGCHKLRQIALGSKFSFNGASASRLCDLPTPDSTYIPDATGKWQAVGSGTAENPNGSVYTASEIPNNTAETYVAQTGTLGTVSISGTESLGNTLTATVTGSKGITPAYQWSRANSATGSFTNISGATKATYALTTADVGKYLRCTVTDSSGTVSGSIYDTTGAIDKGMTTIVGGFSTNSPTVGSTITLNLTKYPTAGSNSFTYTWAYGSGSSWTTISSEGPKSGTSASITVPAPAYGKFLRCTVSGTNTYYTFETIKPVTSSAVGQGELTGHVSISGTESLGNTLTASVSGLPETAVPQYQWYRADAKTGTYTPISGANARTYELATSDVGKYLKCYVTDGSGAYAGTLQSGPTDAIGKGTWGDLSVSINGEKKVNSVLTATPSGAPTEGKTTYQYQWYRADTENGSYVPIDGAISATYTLAEADYGKYVKCGVSGENPYYVIGSGMSAPFGSIGRGAPDDSQAEGEIGGVSWFIRSASDPNAPGELFIYPTNGVHGTMDNLSGTRSGAPWYAYASLPQSIHVEPGVQTNDVIACLFADLVNVKTADVKNLEFHNNTWDFVSLFDNCASMTSVDMSGWDTSTARAFNQMFKGCAKLASVDVNHFNTSKTTAFDNMFQGCSSLTTLDVSNWDMRKAAKIPCIFSGCSSLVSINGLENWDLAEVSLLYGAFQGCKSLEDIDVTGWDTSRASSFDGMFSGCESLVTIPGIETWDTGNANVFAFMFMNCKNLASLDVTHFDTGKGTNFSSMFDCCSSLTSLDVTGFDMASARTTNSMFRYCTSLSTIGVENWETPNLQDAMQMFMNCRKLQSIDLSKWDVRNLKTAYSMFLKCYALRSADFTGWQTDNLTNLYAFLFECSSLTNLKGYEAFNTSKVTTFYGTFFHCAKLSSLDVSGWDTSSATNLQGVFAKCTSLTTIEGLENWNTSKVKNLSLLFWLCESLPTVNLSSFDTSAATNMTDMFDEMPALVEAKLGSKFSFTGNGSTGCVLPTPTGKAPNGNAYTGNWVAKSDAAVYTAADVPSLKADTYNAEIATLGTIVFNGDQRIGYEIVASLEDAVAVSPAYQWAIGNSASGPFTPIEGADSDVYTPTVDDFGKYLQVEATDTLGNVASAIYAVTAKVGAGTLAGSVAISGTPTYGETLSASVTGLSEQSVAKYQWYRSDSATGSFTAIAGATGNTYQLSAGDVSKYLKCCVTDSSGKYEGTLSSNVLGPVAKATPEKPVVIIEGKTDTTITVKPVDGRDDAQYSKDGGRTWQDSNVFEGLDPDTEYEIVIKVPETDVYEEAVSDPVTVRTDYPQISVLVPASLKVQVSGDGALTFPTDQRIQNLTAYNVKLDSVKSTKANASFGDSDWRLHKGASAAGTLIGSMAFGSSGTIASPLVIAGNQAQPIYWESDEIVDVGNVLGGSTAVNYGTITYTMAYAGSTL